VTDAHLTRTVGPASPANVGTSALDWRERLVCSRSSVKRRFKHQGYSRFARRGCTARVSGRSQGRVAGYSAQDGGRGCRRRTVREGVV